MEKVLYFILGIYTVMINWFYNESIITALLTWIFWPIYLFYALLTGHLAHEQWKLIPQSYLQ